MSDSITGTSLSLTIRKYCYRYLVGSVLTLDESLLVMHDPTTSGLYLFTLLENVYSPRW